MDMLSPFQEQAQEPGQEGEQGDQSGFVEQILLSFQVEVQDELKLILVPRAMEIGQGLTRIGDLAQTSALASNGEYSQAQAELQRLSNLIQSFTEAVHATLHS